MSSSIVREIPGLFTIDVISNDSVVDIHNFIPIQTLTLKNVRLEMTADTVALATKIVYADLPFLGQNQLIDGVVGRYNLPITLDNAAVTTYQPDMALHMTRNIDETFRVRVVDKTGALVSNFVAMTLQFTYDFTQLGS